MKNIDYGQIIKRSWELTRKNKWLWVIGMVLAAFGGAGGFRGGSGGSSNSSNFSLPSPSPKSLPNLNNVQYQTNKVMGAATDVIKSWFSSVPISNWILLALLILVFILFTAVVSWVITSWAKGALISGLFDADQGSTVDLKSVSSKGMAKINDLVVFRLISLGITIALVLGLAVIVGLGLLVKIAVPILGTVWLIIFGVLGVLAFVIALFLFTMLQIYAERLIVLRGMSAWNAWKNGLSLAKGNILPTMVMGLINSIIGCFVGCIGLVVLLIIFGIPVFIVIYPSFNHGFHFPGLPQIVSLIILVVLFFAANLLVRGVLVVFNYGTWNLFFKQIVEETKNA